MSKFAVLRPVTVMMMSLALIVLGFISLSKIKLRLLPALNVPFVTITTKFTGATPFEVEEKVTNPIEQAMSTVPGLYSMQSESRTGLSIINLKFKNIDNMLKLLSELRDRVNSIYFEKGVGRPKITRAHTKSSPVFKVAIAPNNDNESDLVRLGNYLEGTLVKKFDGVDNVAIVDILGKPSKQINLRINPTLLSAYNLSIDKISAIIAKKNKILSAGQIEINESRLGIRVINQLKSANDIMNLFIPIDKKKFIQLKEISKIESILKSPDISTSLNGGKTLIVEVYKSANGNTVKITDELEKIFNDFRDNNSMTSTVLLNQGTAIADSIDNVVNAVLNGGVLAAVILFLFLGSLTPTLIVSVAIPMSVIITLILMYFTKVTFNLMSLGGLALGIGMLVDNAIVVLENINQMRSKMQDQYQAIIWGTKKVTSAIIASTLTTVAVFAPLVFVEGMIGQLFRDISLTVIYSLSASLFVALILIPCLSRLGIKNEKSKKTSLIGDLAHLIENLFDYHKGRSTLLHILLKPFILVFSYLKQGINVLFFLSSAVLRFFSKIFAFSIKFLLKTFEYFSGPIITFLDLVISKMKKAYSNYLLWSLKRAKIPLLLCFTFFIMSLIGFSRLGAEFFPNEGLNRLSYSLRFKAGQLKSLSFEQLNTIENKVLDIGGVAFTSATIGKKADNIGELLVSLSKGENSVAIDKKVKTILKDIPELSFTVIKESLVSSEKPVQIEIYDQDLNKLEQNQKEIVSVISNIPGIKDIEGSIKDKVDEIRIIFDSNQINYLGIDPSFYSNQIKSIINPSKVTEINEVDSLTPVLISGTKNFFNSPEALRQFAVTKEGHPITLGQVSNLTKTNSIDHIRHNDGVRVAIVSADISDRSLKEVSDQIKTSIEQNLGKEVKWKLVGQDLERKKSEESMLMAILFSIFLIYILLASQFENLKQPFIILIAVPLCIIGVYLILFIGNHTVSPLVLVGFVILSGISVNTSIVLVDTINQLKHGNMELGDAIIFGSGTRLKPILMTSLTTIIGLIPMAIGSGSGSSMRQSLALTVIGGLISSTILTLLIVPLIYQLFAKKSV